MVEGGLTRKGTAERLQQGLFEFGTKDFNRDLWGILYERLDEMRIGDIFSNRKKVWTEVQPTLLENMVANFSLIG